MRGVNHGALSSRTMLELDDLAPERIRPLRRVEYERMVELGLFEDERVELLAGMLVEMSPQGVPHAHAVRYLTELFILALRRRATIGSRLRFALDDESEPEPDIVISPRADYRREHPGRALLLVEVAESSLRKDRRIKARLYARAEVPEYWLVNLVDGLVEVHRDPEAGRYRTITQVGRGESLAPLAFPDIVLQVDELLTGEPG